MDRELKTRLQAIRHVVLDMDGTIYMGSTLFPYTLPFLERLGRLGISYSFLTNNPSKSIDDYLERLAGFGVPCRRDRMHSTAETAIGFIHSRYPQAKRLFLLGTPSMAAQFEQAGFISCADSPEDVPDAVVAAFDMSLTYSRLCRFCWWVSRRDISGDYSIPYIATNPDWVCPTDSPTVLVDCGSLCACIEAATGRRPDAVMGKPNPAILQNVLDLEGLAPYEAAMVGDRLYTDVKTALNAGSMGVLVLSGETTAEMASSADPEVLVCRDIEEFGLMLEEARR